YHAVVHTLPVAVNSLPPSLLDALPICVRPGQQFTAERADERSTNSMNITYTQNGDYLIPNIIIRKTKPLGHYGRLRKAYLEMHRDRKSTRLNSSHVSRSYAVFCLKKKK